MSHSLAEAQSEVTEQTARSSDLLVEMMRQGRSYSARERNCCFLNASTGGGPTRFADVSGVSGFDFLDDGRSLALVDWDRDGRMDVWAFNRTAPRLRLLRNQAPAENRFVALLLQGDGESTNRDAVGARVVVVTDEPGPRRLAKTVRAGEGFMAQSSRWRLFGIGPSAGIQEVVVRWPGGETESFSGVAPAGHYLLRQHSGQARRWGLDSSAESVIAAGGLELPTTDSPVRVTLQTQLPTGSLSYRGFGGEEKSCHPSGSSHVLINLWATWCQPCVAELAAIQRCSSDLRAAGITVYALSVDGFGRSAENAAIEAQQALRSLEFSFPAGMATEELVQVLQFYHDQLLVLSRPLPVPSSFLMDPEGKLIAIYKGPLVVDQLLDDVQSVSANTDRRPSAARLPGSFVSHPRLAEVASRSELNLRLHVAAAIGRRGDLPRSAVHYQAAVDMAPDSPVARFNYGAVLAGLSRWEEAAEQFRQAASLNSASATSRLNLGVAYANLKLWEPAREQFQQTLKLEPRRLDAHVHLGYVYLHTHRPTQALDCFREALSIEPGHAPAQQGLAEARAAAAIED